MYEHHKIYQRMMEEFFYEQLYVPQHRDPRFFYDVESSENGEDREVYDTPQYEHSDIP